MTKFARLEAPHSAFLSSSYQRFAAKTCIVHVRPHWQAACLVCMRLVEEAVLPSVQLTSVWRPVRKQWCEFWAPHQGSSWTWMPKILMGFTGLHVVEMQENLQSWLWSLTSPVWSVSSAEALQEVQRHKKRKKQTSQTLQTSQTCRFCQFSQVPSLAVLEGLRPAKELWIVRHCPK